MVEELPSMLWEHKTTYKVATRETPFVRTCGGEVVIPVEVSIPSYQVVHHDQFENKRDRIDELDLLDERREVAVMHLKEMKRQVVRYYDKKMQSHGIKAGALVLKCNFRPVPRKESWRPNEKVHTAFF
ncbi:unnamed protein product [Linum trigynum]|uniref:Uncharacterized protein n=1 Tax=Linum trigynum TaxID=586398 RepID=A0AAV2E5P6_9ROSI